MENCRKCSAPFDANDLTSGGMFGTCNGCLKARHAEQIRASAPAPARLGKLNVKWTAEVADAMQTARDRLFNQEDACDTVFRVVPETERPIGIKVTEIRPTSRKLKAAFCCEGPDKTADPKLLKRYAKSIIRHDYYSQVVLGAEAGTGRAVIVSEQKPKTTGIRYEDPVKGEVYIPSPKPPATEEELQDLQFDLWSSKQPPPPSVSSIQEDIAYFRQKLFKALGIEKYLQEPEVTPKPAMSYSWEPEPLKPLSSEDVAKAAEMAFDSVDKSEWTDETKQDLRTKLYNVLQVPAHLQVHLKI